jgi:hypothetical protein
VELTMRALKLRTLALLASGPACALWLTGCMGGQTGGEFDGGGEGPPHAPGKPTEYGCKDTKTAVALFDSSRLGFSAADVLAYSAGNHAASLLWSTPAIVPVRFGPEQGSSSLEMTIEHAGGDVRFVESEPAESGEGGTSSGAAVVCGPDRLEIDITVRFATGGGALSESFAGVLVASVPGRAELSHDWPIDRLSGSFFVELPASYSAPKLSINAQLEPLSFRGNIWGVVEQQVGSGTDGSVGATHVIYATWPAP